MAEEDCSVEEKDGSLRFAELLRELQRGRLVVLGALLRHAAGDGADEVRVAADALYVLRLAALGELDAARL